MKEGIQILLAEAGEAACYALDIIDIAEEETLRPADVVGAIQRGIDAKMIRYNERDRNDPNNFFVEDPAGFLTLMTGEGWTVEKVGPEYEAKPGEQLVDRWEAPGVTGIHNHFRRPKWDSWPGSKAVMYGKIVSRRVFRRKRK